MWTRIAVYPARIPCKPPIPTPTTIKNKQTNPTLPSTGKKNPLRSVPPPPRGMPLVCHSMWCFVAVVFVVFSGMLCFLFVFARARNTRSVVRVVIPTRYTGTGTSWSAVSLRCFSYVVFTFIRNEISFLELPDSISGPKQLIPKNGYFLCVFVCYGISFSNPIIQIKRKQREERKEEREKGDGGGSVYSELYPWRASLQFYWHSFQRKPAATWSRCSFHKSVTNLSVDAISLRQV